MSSCAPRGDQRTRSPARRAAAGAACLGLFALLAAAGPRVAAAGSSATFNPPVAIPDGDGATASALVVTGDGQIYGAGAGGSAGCTLFKLSHNGSSATFLGRTPGGSACALTTSVVPSGGALAAATQLGRGTLTGRTDGAAAASFQWAALSQARSLGSLAVDPAPNSGGSSDVFLLVAGQRGNPRVAVSNDGGLTYTLGSALDTPAVSTAGGPPLAGNLVARRDGTGLHLYSVLATPDGITVALGTVAPLAGQRPSVAWQDITAYHAPAGAQLNQMKPAVAVDSAGAVYVTFSDGRHVDVLTSPDGTTWNPAQKPVAVDTSAAGVPAGTTAVAAPALAAGSAGKVDLAWLGAHADSWSAYMAQSLDGGQTWNASTLSGATPLHTGALAPGTTLQLAVDQVSGAAVAAFSGDSSAGLPSLFATRQCTGISAVTGGSLVDDCVASQPATPVLPGTTCPGPQVTDPAGDAIDTMSVAKGSNLESLDLLQVRFGTPAAGMQSITMSLNRASAQLPAGVTRAWWVASWNQGSVRRYADAVISSGAQPRFGTGLVRSDGSLGPATAVTGVINPGANGSIAIALPLSAMGNPAVGTTLNNISASTYAQFADVVQTGTQLVDRAPDGGSGADYAVAQVCAPQTDLPDVPAAVLVPVVGGLVGLFVFFQRHRRARRAQP